MVLNMKDMKDTVRSGYDLGSYEEEFRKNQELSRFEEELLEKFVYLVKPGGHLLDLGCGTGIPFGRYLSGKGFSLTGIDFSRKHLEKAAVNMPGAELLHVDMSEYSYPEGIYDGALAMYSIFHLPRTEHESIIRGIGRTLVQGGILLATLGTEGYEYSEEENWAGSPLMAWSSWSPEDYENMLARNGFRTLEKKYQGVQGDREYHLWVIAESTI